MNRSIVALALFAFFAAGSASAFDCRPQARAAVTAIVKINHPKATNVSAASRLVDSFPTHSDDMGYQVWEVTVYSNGQPVMTPYQVKLYDDGACTIENIQIMYAS